MYLVKTPNIIRYFFKDYIWNIDTNKKELYLTFDDGPTPEVTLFVLELLKKYHAKATFFCIGKNIENHPEIFKQLINEGHSIGNHTANHNNGWKTNNTDYLKSIADCEESIANYKPQTQNEIATLPLAMTSENQKSQNSKTQITNKIATLPLAMTSENKIKIKNQSTFQFLPLGKTEDGKQVSSLREYGRWENQKTKDQRLKTIRPPYGKIKRSQAKKLIAKGYKIIMWSVLSGDFDAKISKEKCLQNVIKNANKGSIIVFHDSKKAYNHLKYALPKVLAYFSEKGYIFKAL